MAYYFPLIAPEPIRRSGGLRSLCSYLSKSNIDIKPRVKWHRKESTTPDPAGGSKISVIIPRVVMTQVECNRRAVSGRRRKTKAPSAGGMRSHSTTLRLFTSSTARACDERVRCESHFDPQRPTTQHISKNVELQTLVWRGIDGGDAPFNYGDKLRSAEHELSTVKLRIFKMSSDNESLCQNRRTANRSKTNNTFTSAKRLTTAPLWWLSYANFYTDTKLEKKWT